MIIVIITRLDYTDKSTSGILSVPKENGYAWIAKTLELPDKNNQPKISCIPKGIYQVKYTMSPSFKKHTYEIQGVPDRAGIRIHSGNFTRQILGCILLGKELVDIDKDGTIDITESRKTIEEFESLLNYEPFTLTIQ
jgi:hypothetical protein